MRFKKGDKVEVMNDMAVPISWHPGQILHGGDHTCHVQYDFDPSMESGQMVEMVSRKCVRPLLPLMHDLGSCNPGDIVEVFYENSWKVSVVLKFMGGKKIRQKAASLRSRYLVRLLGTLQELIVYRLNMRMRRTWYGGKWTLMGKTSQAGNDFMSGKCKTINIRESQFNAMAKHQAENDSVRSQHNLALWNSPLVSGRPRKRTSPYGSSIVEAQNGHLKKLRAMEKEERLVAAQDLEKG